MSRRMRQLRRRWRRLQFYMLQRLGSLVRLVGFSRMRAVGEAVGELQFRLDRQNRLRCTRDLARVLGQNGSDAEAARILRRAYRLNTAAMLELMAMYARSLSDEEIFRIARVRNLERLDAYLAASRPVILLNHHMGNFPLIQIFLRRAGYPVSVVYRESNKMRPGFFEDGLGLYGVDSIPVKEGTRGYRRMVKALRANRIVCVIMDQGTKQPGGIPLSFLGKELMIPAGPVQLARHTGAVILPMPLLAAEPAWEADVLEPIELDPDAPIEDDVRRVAAVMEREILAHPELWTWPYRRWRFYPLLPELQDSAGG